MGSRVPHPKTEMNINALLFSILKCTLTVGRHLKLTPKERLPQKHHQQPFRTANASEKKKKKKTNKTELIKRKRRAKAKPHQPGTPN